MARKPGKLSMKKQISSRRREQPELCCTILARNGPPPGPVLPGRRGRRLGPSSLAGGTRIAQIRLLTAAATEFLNRVLSDLRPATFAANFNLNAIDSVWLVSLNS